MKVFLIGVLVLLAWPSLGQQLQILRPDSRVFTSVSPGDYLVLKTIERDHVAGKLVAISADTLTVSDRDQTRQITLGQITALKKTTKFGLTARHLSLYAAVVPVLLVPSANGRFYEGRTWGYRAWTSAAIVIPVGVGLGFLLQGSPLKKAKKGYSFQVVP
jgi:hypothetical protein